MFAEGDIESNKKSPASLDRPLSCARPLPVGLFLEPNGAFIFNSRRRNRRTGQFVEGTGVPSLSPTEEQDSKSFQCLVEHYVPELRGLLSFSSRLWDKRIAGLDIEGGLPIHVCLVNGTRFEIKLILSATYIVQIVSSIHWDRILESKSYMSTSNHHRITWHPYNRISLRMGRQLPTLECRRVVDTVCSRWMHGTRRRNKSLGVVGEYGKTTVLRQLLRTLTEYHSERRIGVLSETCELYGMEGVIDIPWELNWREAVHESNLQVLVVDCTTIDYDKLPCGLFVVASGWSSAGLVLQIRGQEPRYRLDRRSPRINVTP